MYNNNNNNLNYGNSSYGNNYRNNNNYSNKQQSNNNVPKKHSGAKSGMTKTGKMYVQGWNVSKSNGMVSIIAGPTKNTDTHKSKSGRTWCNWMAKVTPKMAVPFLVSCLYDESTGKVIINDLGIVMNPKAPHGGYCGKFGGKR